MFILKIWYKKDTKLLNNFESFDNSETATKKDIVIQEVELEGVSKERNEDDSKVVAKKITIGKSIL